jgi:hypothetical protein
VVSVSVACIYNLLSVYASLAEARNCAHTSIRSTRDAQRSVRCRDSKSVEAGSQNFSTHCFLFFRRHARFIFPVKRIFLV